MTVNELFERLRGLIVRQSRDLEALTPTRDRSMFEMAVVKFYTKYHVLLMLMSSHNVLLCNINVTFKKFVLNRLIDSE